MALIKLDEKRAEVSSTNFILPGQFLSKELMRTANNNDPTFYLVVSHHLFSSKRT
jgi:hypothetical protein